MYVNVCVYVCMFITVYAGGRHSEGDRGARVVGHLDAGLDLERLLPLPALAERAAEAAHGQGRLTVVNIRI